MMPSNFPAPAREERELARARFRAAGSYAGSDLDDSRAFIRGVRPPGGPPVARIVDTHVGAAPAVAVRTYHPSPGEELPMVAWTHGGGWCVGDLDTTDTVCRHLATRAGCVVVSIDHRRAPEHPFPGPLDDVVAVVGCLAAEAARIGAAPELLAVGGESSGAHLTLSALLHLRGTDPALVGRIQQQLLVVPVVDLADRPSMRADADPGLTVADLRWFERQYLPDPARRSDPRAWPLRSASLAGLPPTTVVTAGLDPLRDSGLELVARLAEDGVPVAHRDRAGAGHGLLGDLSPGSAGDDVLAHLVSRLDGQN